MAARRSEKIILMELPKLEYFSYLYSQEESFADCELSLSEIEKHPCFKALSETEQTVYLLHRMGRTGKEIAKETGLRRDQICRLLAEIKARFLYLFRFREVLRRSKSARKKFFKAFADDAIARLLSSK